MRKFNKTVQNMIDRIDRRQLRNNTQRALLTLLTTDSEWVSRTSMRIPSAAARLRDLRKEEFGGFKVECASATELKRNAAPRQTFYRLDTRTVTASRLQKAFEGVVTTSK